MAGTQEPSAFLHAGWGQWQKLRGGHRRVVGGVGGRGTLGRHPAPEHYAGQVGAMNYHTSPSTYHLSALMPAPAHPLLYLPARSHLCGTGGGVGGAGVKARGDAGAQATCALAGQTASSHSALDLVVRATLCDTPPAPSSPLSLSPPSPSLPHRSSVMTEPRYWMPSAAKVRAHTSTASWGGGRGDGVEERCRSQVEWAGGHLYMPVPFIAG